MHASLPSIYLLIAWMIGSTGTLHAATAEIRLRSASGQYEDVKERVVFAVENRGIVLNYTARVGSMLERTGRDLGRSKQIYGQAEVIEFCSAALSRDAMEADPHSIAYCPYSIAVYTLPQEPGRVFVAYRRLGAANGGASARALAAVEKLLEDIVSEALR